MELTAAAQWLNETFASLDLRIFTIFEEAFHQTELEPVWNVIYTAITRTCNGGLAVIFLSLFLMIFKKTRKAGTAMLLGIGIGAVFTNVALKPLVARPRPYTHTEMPFYQWWVHAGGLTETDKSFPSGHTTTAMSAMSGLFFVTNKKISWLAFLFALAVGMSRIFFFVHYPTDVFAGLITGLIAGLISGILINWLYARLNSSLKTNYASFTFFKKKS